MDSDLILNEIVTREDIVFFWQRRNKYMIEDIIPNCVPPLTKEEEQWFFSQEYKDHIMKLYQREIDRLNIVFFLKNMKYVGFAVYVIYHSEDGKCFIVEYCIEPQYRNEGLGKKFFKLLETKSLKSGATYFALNLSNENNERFWKSNGFLKAYKDEFDSDVYVKKY